MKGKYFKRAAAGLLTAAMVAAFLPEGALPVSAADTDGVNMYRLYNQTTHEHFYTANLQEKNHLTTVGWKYEGIGWVAPKSGKPVYRMYNPGAKDHHYTLNANEKDFLVKAGWKYEGIGWYSDEKHTVPVYRDYNPKLTSGAHNYTADANEHAYLHTQGWRDEKIGWYGIAKGASSAADSGAGESAAVDSAFQEKTTGISTNTAGTSHPYGMEEVSPISEFRNPDGSMGFAMDTEGNSIDIYDVSGMTAKKKFSLPKKGGDLFGAVTRDKDGNYYTVMGKQNMQETPGTPTVFVSKFSAAGTFVATAYDDGNPSMLYDDTGFHSRLAFDFGNCDVTINGNLLATHYARGMINSHQSDAVFFVDITNMSAKTAKDMFVADDIYNSHSLGQRVTNFGNGFVVMSEGDGYPRAFRSSYYDPAQKQTYNKDIFHFWGSDPENYATIGDVCDLGNGTVSFVASSAKSLTSAAESEPRQAFIQIFDPKTGNMVTSGSRSGVSLDKSVTDNGVLWLTNLGPNENVIAAQAASDGAGNTYVLYSKMRQGPNSYDYNYLGLYTVTVDAKGNIIRPERKLSSTAYLNLCETPIYHNGTIQWVGNKEDSWDLYVYSFDVTKK
ncbi:MAG: hypothetical protein VZQ80_09215 [Lachnospiraceae bacterium]|nr:hypothetical protein [Lachnospiraceae bacterium]